MSSSKIVGIIASGLIGTDPYDDNAWSGSSKYFFTECGRQKILHRAFGVEVNKITRAILAAKNFSVDRTLWKHNFYLDTQYYDLLTKDIINNIRKEDLDYTLLQIGGIYDLKSVLRDKARVFSYHDGNLAQAIQSPYFLKNISDSRVKKALNYEKNVYDGLDKIFTMSEYLKDSFVNDFNISEKKLRVIGAGINIDTIPTIENKNYERKNILFIGMDFYRKGGLDLLKAFKVVRKKYSSAVLNIVGPKALDILPEYSSGVLHHGFLSKKELTEKAKLHKIMNDSSIFVLPSLYEPFGISPLEAMAYEIPCILTNAWAFPEMVIPGINGELIKCGDVNELAEKILLLLQDPDKLKVMGKAGREMVLKKYTWERVVNILKNEI